MAASLKQKSGPGDTAAMYMFIKSIDPTGQVTQSDYGTLSTSTGWLQPIVAQWNSLVTAGKSGKVTATMRKEFMDAATAMMTATAGEARTAAEQAKKDAVTWRAYPEQVVIGDFADPERVPIEELMTPDELEEAKRLQQEKQQYEQSGGAPIQGSVAPQGAPAQRPRQGGAQGGAVGRINPLTGKLEMY